MSEEPQQRVRPDERLQVNDSLGIVLTKADGNIVTNKPQRINTEYLLKIVEEARLKR